MAGYPAIAATSEAILGLLKTASVASEFAGLDFDHYGSADFASPMKAGVSLHLYRVSVTAGRNLPPREGRDGRLYRAPIPLDLHYLITAWAETPVRQQRLLGWAVRTLEDTPILPAGVLNQRSPEPDLFDPGDSVELVWDPLTLRDSLDIWEMQKTKIQPSATYRARMVRIDSSIPIETAGEVQTRALEFAPEVPA